MPVRKTKTSTVPAVGIEVVVNEILKRYFKGAKVGRNRFGQMTITYGKSKLTLDVKLPLESKRDVSKAHKLLEGAVFPFLDVKGVKDVHARFEYDGKSFKGVINLDVRRTGYIEFEITKKKGELHVIMTERVKGGLKLFKLKKIAVDYIIAYADYVL